MADLLERVRAGGLLRHGPAGARAALRRPRLRLPARPRGAARRGRRGAALQLRPARRRPAPTRRTAPRCARGSASRCTSRRPRGAGRQPAGLGARRALRGGRAAGGAAGRRRRRRPHGVRPGRDGPLPARRARPGGAPCSAWPRATAGSCGRCWRARARRPPPTARARGLEWREDASNDDPAFARNRVRAGLLPALRALHPAAEANVLRTLELLRDEAAVLDAVARRRARRGRRSARPSRRSARAAAGAARGSRCSGWPTARPAGGRRPWATAREEVLALGEGGALDLGGGVRAAIRRGALTLGPSAGRAAPRRGAVPS